MSLSKTFSPALWSWRCSSSKNFVIISFIFTPWCGCWFLWGRIKLTYFSYQYHIDPEIFIQKNILYLFYGSVNFVISDNHLQVDLFVNSTCFVGPFLFILKPVLHACTPSQLSHVLLFATLWTVAHQGPQYMGFSGQEY